MPGAWYIHNNDYCQICMYHSFSPFWFSLHFYVSSQKPNLRHIGKKAHHLASITRVIIFAVRPFALFGRVKGKPAACIAVINRVYTVPCSVFLLPCYTSGGFLCLVFICYFLLFWFLMQRYCKYLKRASNFENKCLFFNVYYNYYAYLGGFINI